MAELFIVEEEEIGSIYTTRTNLISIYDSHGDSVFNGIRSAKKYQNNYFDSDDEIIVSLE